MLFNFIPGGAHPTATIDEVGGWSGDGKTVLDLVFGRGYAPSTVHHLRGRSVAVAEDVARLFGATIDYIEDDEINPETTNRRSGVGGVTTLHPRCTFALHVCVARFIAYE